MYVGVVLNPLARKNRADAERRAAILRDMLGARGAVRLTRSLEEVDEAIDALLPRATHLVSDGGDGALHWLLNAVRARVADPAEWPAFVPTNGGTIDFVARKAGVRGRSRGIVRALVHDAEAGREPDVVTLASMHLGGAHRDGAAFDRIGFALAAGGVGNRFFDKYYEDPEPRPSTIVKVILRSVSELAASKIAPRWTAGRVPYADHVFAPTHARVSIDGEALPYTVHAGIHAGAFDVNLGGVLRVFPFAREPGRLHFQAGQISPLGMVANLPALATGGAIRGPRLRDTAGEEMVVEALGDEALSPILDGERFEALDRIVITCGPPVRVASVRGD